MENEPATKQDVGDLRTEMKAMEDRLVEGFRDGQAELLKAFYSLGEAATSASYNSKGTKPRS